MVYSLHIDVMSLHAKKKFIYSEAEHEKYIR